MSERAGNRARKPRERKTPERATPGTVRSCQRERTGRDAGERRRSTKRGNERGKRGQGAESADAPDGSRRDARELPSIAGASASAKSRACPLERRLYGEGPRRVGRTGADHRGTKPQSSAQDDQEKAEAKRAEARQAKSARERGTRRRESRGAGSTGMVRGVFTGVTISLGAGGEHGPRGKRKAHASAGTPQRKRQARGGKERRRAPEAAMKKRARRATQRKRAQARDASSDREKPARRRKIVDNTGLESPTTKRFTQKHRRHHLLTTATLTKLSSEAQPKNLLFHKPLEKQMLRFRSA